MERYAVTRDEASGIVNDANDWAEEHGNPRLLIKNYLCKFMLLTTRNHDAKNTMF